MSPKHNPLKSAVCLASLLLLAGITGAQNYSVLKKIPLAGDGGWDYLSVDSDSHRLFISRGTHVQVMDTESGAIVGDIPDTSGVHGIVLDTVAGKGFTSNGRDATVTVFDSTSYAKLASVKVGEGPDAILFEPTTERVLTFNGRSQDATVIDAKTNGVLGTIKLDGRPEFPAADGHGHIYVNIEDKSEVQEIDAEKMAVLRTWSIAPGDGPSGMAVDGEHHRSFSVCGNNLMVISDTEAGKVFGTVKIGNGPDAAGFDPGTGIAFSSNGEGTLTLAKAGEDGVFTVVQEVKTQPSARTMAVDTKTHKVYLIAAEFTAAEAGQRRGKMKPGSAVIVVVGTAE